MPARSTLIVAGRKDDSLQKEALQKLILGSLITAYGEEATGVDAELADFAKEFKKPEYSEQYGLNTCNDVNATHLVRIQYNPTATQFRACLRECLAHALNTGRVSETEPSIDGHVTIVYAGQVMSPSGDWLMADCALDGHQVLSWLDSKSARVWWPQLDKFPNVGDRLHAHLMTPLAGSGTTWPINKNGHPHTLLAHLDVRMVELVLHIEGAHRSNGKLVVPDPTHTISFEGIRTFVQLAMDHHPSTALVMKSDSPPLGCALSAQRPALYIFPGGGITSQASALFSIQGFSMLLGGGFTSTHPPNWWAMVRNLPKLDAIVFPDWSASNLLSYQFLLDVLKSELPEKKILGALLVPPPTASSDPPSEFTLNQPSSVSDANQYAWAPNNIGTENLPPAQVLYAKFGWGELKVQPLAQHAGLVFLWTSKLDQPTGTHAHPLRILIPATQLIGASPVQGLGRLLKSLATVPQLEDKSATAAKSTSSSVGRPKRPSPARPASAKTSSIPSRVTTTTGKPLANSTAAKTIRDASPRKPNGVPAKRPISASTMSTTRSAPPPSKPSTRPQTAHIPTKATTQAKAPPKPAVPSSKPIPSKPKTGTTADRLAAHANFVANKKSAPAPSSKDKPKSVVGTAPQRPPAPIAKTKAPSPLPEETVHEIVPSSAAFEQPSNETRTTSDQLRDSLELAAVDPLISGWRSMEQSYTHPPEDLAAPVLPSHLEPEPVSGEEQHSELVAQAPSELYKVHKFEHFNEADEMDDSHETPMPHNDIGDDLMEPTKLPMDEPDVAIEVQPDHTQDTSNEQAFEQIPESEIQCIDPSVASVLKVIDPAVVQSYQDGLDTAHSRSPSYHHSPQPDSLGASPTEPKPSIEEHVTGDEEYHPQERFVDECYEERHETQVTSFAPSYFGKSIDSQDDVCGVQENPAIPTAEHNDDEQLVAEAQHTPDMIGQNNIVLGFDKQASIPPTDEIPHEDSLDGSHPSSPIQKVDNDMVLGSALDSGKFQDLHQHTQYDENELSPLAVDNASGRIVSHEDSLEAPEQTGPSQFEDAEPEQFEPDAGQQMEVPRESLHPQGLVNFSDAEISDNRQFLMNLMERTDLTEVKADTPSTVEALNAKIGLIPVDSHIDANVHDFVKEGDRVEEDEILNDPTANLAPEHDDSLISPSTVEHAAKLAFHQPPSDETPTTQVSVGPEDELVLDSEKSAHISSGPDELGDHVPTTLDISEAFDGQQPSETLPEHRSYEEELAVAHDVSAPVEASLLPADSVQEALSPSSVLDMSKDGHVDDLDKAAETHLTHKLVEDKEQDVNSAGIYTEITGAHDDHVSPEIAEEVCAATEPDFKRQDVEDIEVPPNIQDEPGYDRQHSSHADKGSDISDLDMDDREYLLSTQHSFKGCDSTEQQANVQPDQADAIPVSPKHQLFENSYRSDEMGEEVDHRQTVSPDLIANLHPIHLHADHPPESFASSMDVVHSTTTPDGHVDILSGHSYLPGEIHPSEQQPADSTTADGMTETQEPVVFEEAQRDGFTVLSLDATGDHADDQVNLISPASEASVDSVVRGPNKEDSPVAVSSTHPEEVSPADPFHPQPIEHEHHVKENGANGDLISETPFEHSIPATNGSQSNGGASNGADDFTTFGDLSPSAKFRMIPKVAEDAVIRKSMELNEMHQELLQNEQHHLPSPTSNFADTMPKVGGAESPGDFDPLLTWGKPQGLPAPVLPSSTGSKASSTRLNAPSRPAPPSRFGTATKGPASTAGKTSSIPRKITPPTLPPGPPVFLDLIWVPTYLPRVPHELAVEFFARVRARTYVISGEALHPMIGEALLEGKTKWGPNDVERLCHKSKTASDNTENSITILPTDEPYEWTCWLRTPCGRLDRETGESRLQASGFQVLPAASLCDIEYSAGNVAFRCEGVRVDF